MPLAYGKDTDVVMEEPTMNDPMQNLRTGHLLPSPMPLPLNAWLAGFDYIFGYQLKLVREFWGITQDDR